MMKIELIFTDMPETNPITPEDAIRRLKEQFPEDDMTHIKDHLTKGNIKAFLLDSRLVFRITPAKKGTHQ